ncbi:MAG: Asp-tRNA(Asn)/Glu-tRNA(Gln) amidotransferase subunit GatC [Desulfatitalea sp.]
MKITAEQILHVAHLARLNIDSQALDKLSRQVATILEYVDTLAQVDTRGVTPTSHAITVTNAFREDVSCGHLSPEQALANAPSKEEDFIIVPKVIA